MWAREIRAPTWVAGSSGSPTTIFATRAVSRSRKAALMDRCTNTRVPLEQTSPAE